MPEELRVTQELSVGDSKIPYEDDELTLKVVRIGEDEFLVTYQRTDTGETLMSMRVSAGAEPNYIETLDSSFWNITVDGEERPSEDLEQILAEEKITNTEVLREQKTVAFQTEG